MIDMPHSKIAIHMKKDGHTFVLNREECVRIINALVRTRQLELHLEFVPSISKYSDCCIQPACAFSDGGSRGDEVIWLEVDCQECHEGTPVKTSKKK
jgi:hypothetical protein